LETFHCYCLLVELKMDKLILSYKDACLYESDLAILRSDNAWLSDRIITFYFEYIQNEILNDCDQNLMLFVGKNLRQYNN
jgi:hypothetical protein